MKFSPYNFPVGTVFTVTEKGFVDDIRGVDWDDNIFVVLRVTVRWNNECFLETSKERKRSTKPIVNYINIKNVDRIIRRGNGVAEIDSPSSIHLRIPQFGGISQVNSEVYYRVMGKLKPKTHYIIRGYGVELVRKIVNLYREDDDHIDLSGFAAWLAKTRVFNNEQYSTVKKEKLHRAIRQNYKKFCLSKKQDVVRIKQRAGFFTTEPLAPIESMFVTDTKVFNKHYFVKNQPDLSNLPSV